MGSYLETTRQEQELTKAERDVSDLETALSSDRDTLGMFVSARGQLAVMRGSALSMRGRLLDAELDYLKGRATGGGKAEVAALARELDGMTESSSQADSGVGATTDKLQIYEAQVREVQQRAFRIQQVAEEADASGRSLAEVLSNGTSKLSPADLEKVRGELAATREDVAKATTELEGLQSEVTRKKVMRSVESGSIAEDDTARTKAIADYTDLRGRVAAYRRIAQDTDSAAIFAQIDRLWSQLDTMEGSTAEAARVVASGEARETTAVRQRLASTAQKVTELRRDVDASETATRSVATRAVLGGLRTLQGEFEDDVIDAEKGIVDVYWLRRMENADQQQTLVDEQAAMLHDLDARFRVIRENLDQ
jgi:hypothetical protein